MVDEATSGASAPLPRCMWCSAQLPSDSEATCPSCGATLIGEGGESLVPGVTAIDSQAIVRSTTAAKTKSRSRLMSWISGEYDEGEKPAPAGSVSLPSPEVRREMLRLEIEAEVAHLQAEAESIASENAVEQLIPLDVLNAPYPVAAAATQSPDTAVAIEATSDATDAAPAEAAPAKEDSPTG